MMRKAVTSVCIEPIFPRLPGAGTALERAGFGSVHCYLNNAGEVVESKWRRDHTGFDFFVHVLRISGSRLAETDRITAAALQVVPWIRRDENNFDTWQSVAIPEIED